jgi:glucose/arabinose dehydrogenase/mono/diheme cytochrome c family protein
MKKIFLIIASAFVFRLFLISCISATSFDETISSENDSATIARGEAIFKQSCSGCHNFRQDGIGPQLGGLTTLVSKQWIARFINNPQKVINSGDKRAVELFKKYKVVMPSFTALKEDELNSVVAYLSTQKMPAPVVTKGNGNELANPIPEKIKVSNLVGGLAIVTTFPVSSERNELPLTRITKLGFQPNQNNLFIVDLRGKLFQLRNNKPTVYMDMALLQPKFIHKPGLATGFGSFAFHPQFASNGLLYTTHTEPANSATADFAYADSIKVAMQWVLKEWKADNPRDTVFSGKGRELMRVNMVTAIHGVQEITFNPLSKAGNEDYGLLYIGVGEGGSAESGFPFLTHSTEKVWGSILRIDPRGNNSRNKQYGIPKSNPFAKSQNPRVLKEIYAYGFRNPHRITWSSTGKMLVSNVGHANIESLNLVLPGRDYGWPIREGAFVIDPYGNLNKVFALPSNDQAYKITYPVAQFDHDEGNAISGGFEYTGKALPQLKGKFLFGDIPSGRLFYVAVADLKPGKQATIKEWKMTINNTPKTFREVCGSNRVDLHFGQDRQGELYLMTKADGKLYKLVSAELKSNK